MELVKGFIQSFEIKDIDKNNRTVVQAFTRYNVIDSDGDIGRKGMFTKTWSENFHRVKHLLNHDVNKPIGKIQKLWDDDEYAYFSSKVGDHSLGEDYMKMAEGGLITEASYGYNTVKQSKANGGNELLEVKLWEVSSLTGWGANQFTPIISLTKSLGKAGCIENLLHRKSLLEKFCYSSTATDETLQQLEIEKKQIDQAIIELVNNTTEAAPALQPEPSADLMPLFFSIENQIIHFSN